MIARGYHFEIHPMQEHVRLPFQTGRVEGWNKPRVDVAATG